MDRVVARCACRRCAPAARIWTYPLNVGSSGSRSCAIGNNDARFGVVLVEVNGKSRHGSWQDAKERVGCWVLGRGGKSGRQIGDSGSDRAFK
jgi:hypothetical protein